MKDVTLELVIETACDLVLSYFAKSQALRHVQILHGSYKVAPHEKAIDMSLYPSVLGLEHEIRSVLNRLNGDVSFGRFEYKNNSVTLTELFNPNGNALRPDEVDILELIELHKRSMYEKE